MLVGGIKDPNRGMVVLDFMETGVQGDGMTFMVMVLGGGGTKQSFG
jgi:hypothetical protein